MPGPRSCLAQWAGPGAVEPWDPGTAPAQALLSLGLYLVLVRDNLVFQGSWPSRSSLRPRGLADPGSCLSLL